MTFRLGLTGSIGMGKSTTAEMFAREGCAVWDADATVHRLYGPGGAAVAPLASAFPAAVVDGAVDRAALRAAINADPAALGRIEAIVHPLVQADRADFARQTSADIAVFDIPLLFETGAEAEMDAVACVRVSRETQADRVLARGTMTRDQFEVILAKQMPIDDKVARAEYVIDTTTLESAARDVHSVLNDIRSRL
ncbi:Dephospho-CoA kinase [Roseivivax jejudonensis]|uniref:Dephospho-CoA kinase n=1 Tax=Roseivivax jejudonensis TaxID=1529041 RepID=A0A1X6ZNE2_9RHOB|nr:dephospho-CoA kinase [Roseivivax jejudonensis]SLN56371.1 Dephospho-CoA kinase [Roseivivax jejudonensis]